MYSPKQLSSVRNLYVKPLGYEKILEALNKHHLAVICGAPGMGKSFTARYLSDQASYNPWDFDLISHENLISKLKFEKFSLRAFYGRLRNISEYEEQSHLRLDDPFGELTYEPTIVLERDLSRLVNRFASRKQQALIISTRREIFMEAMSHREGEELLRKLGVDEDVIFDIEYDSERLEEIFLRYVSLYKPAWWPDIRLKNLIFDRATEVFTTPLSIELFVRLSASFKDDAPLLALVEKCTEPKAFLKDKIIEMSVEEQILILMASSIFPSNITHDECIAGLYDSILEEAKSRKFIEETEFNDLLAIQKRLDGWLGYTIAVEDMRSPVLINPIYEEALELALDSDQRLRELLAAAIYATAKSNNVYTRYPIARSVPRLLDKLGDESIALFDAFSSDASIDARRELAEGMANYLAGLDARYWQFVERLAADESTMVAAYMAAALADNYENLDEKGRALVKDLAYRRPPEVAKFVGRVLAIKYEKLGKDGRAFLSDIIEESSPVTVKELAGVLAWNHANLDEQGNRLLYSLAKHSSPEIRGSVACWLAEDLPRLDQEARNMFDELLGDEDPSIRSFLAIGLVLSIEHQKEAGRELLRGLIDDLDEASAGQIAANLAQSYDYLDDEAVELLERLLSHKSEKVRAPIAHYLFGQFGIYNIDNRQKRLLERLSQDPSAEVRQVFASQFIRFYDHQDNTQQALLARLAADSIESVRAIIAGSLARHWNEDEQSREHIRRLLSGDSLLVTKHLAFGVAQCFPNLDEEGKQIVHKLAADKSEEIRQSVASGLALYADNLASEGRDLLRRLARDRSPQVRSGMCQPLACFWHNLDQEGRELVEELAADKSVVVRKEIARGLKEPYLPLDEAGRNLLQKIRKSLSE